MTSASPISRIAASTAASSYAIAALAADGALGDVSSAVDAQRARDNSATGYQAAVRARAAVNTAENAARKAMEHGMKKVDVFVKGPGSGRETAIRSLQAAGLVVYSI